MSISSSDVFSIGWVSSYETAFDYECQIYIECYGSVIHQQSYPIVALMSNLKSRIHMVVSKGNTFLSEGKWQQVVIAGEVEMHDFVLSIMTGLVRMNHQQAEQVVFAVAESLEEGCYNFSSDPRMN